jgi:hypothetical protein
MAGRLLAGLTRIQLLRTITEQKEGRAPSRQALITRIQLLRTITEQKEGRAPSHRSIHLSELQLLGLNGCLQLVCLTG